MMSEIVGLGGICVDRLALLRRMPDWDEVEEIVTSTTQLGGMVSTAMVAAARLGAQAECVGGVGADEDGRYALDTLRQAQVAAARIRTLPGEKTASSLVLVHQGSGKRTILHDCGVQRQPVLSESPLDLTGARFLHLDGYWPQTALATARRAKAQGVAISLDPSSTLLCTPAADEIFRLADYLIPGYALAARLTGQTEPFTAAAQLLARYHNAAVIITNGEAGSFVVTADTQCHIPAFQVAVVDTTGAGDTFHGAFLVGLEHGWALPQAVQFATAAAALKCTRLGGQAGIPTLAETRQFLSAQGIVLP